jgi:hypothetical protein
MSVVNKRVGQRRELIQGRLLGLEDPRLYANSWGNLRLMTLRYPLLMGLKDLGPWP